MPNKLLQNRTNYTINYNYKALSTSIPGQLNFDNPIIDNDLYLLINGENGTGNVLLTGTPANRVPYPGFGGSRAIYSTVDRSLYQHPMVNTFTGGMHPGSAFKCVYSTVDSRSGTRYWFAPLFPSIPNLLYFPNFKVTLDSFIAGCSVRIPKPPVSRVNTYPYRLSLLGTGLTPNIKGWYTYLSVEYASDPTPAYLATALGGQIIDKNMTDKLVLKLYLVYNNQVTLSHTLNDFKFNTWIDLAWSYHQNVVFLNINNNIKECYNLPTLNPRIGGSYDLTLGPIVPNSYRFMGSIDNLYIKKYV